MAVSGQSEWWTERGLKIGHVTLEFFDASRLRV